MDHAREHDDAPIDDEALRAYIADTLPPDRTARVEKALQASHPS